MHLSKTCFCLLLEREYVKLIILNVGLEKTLEGGRTLGT